MKLPEADAADVDRRKVREYLLNPGHPDNGGKATVFLSLGFTRDGWRELGEAFRKLARNAEVSEIVESPHGVKYVVDGEIGTSSGKRARVRTVWIINRGETTPRLVTAYPCE